MKHYDNRFLHRTTRWSTRYKIFPDEKANVVVIERYLGNRSTPDATFRLDAVGDVPEIIYALKTSAETANGGPITDIGPDDIEIIPQVQN